MDPWAYHYVLNFLASCVTVSFCVRTEVHGVYVLLTLFSQGLEDLTSGFEMPATRIKMKRVVVRLLLARLPLLHRDQRTLVMWKEGQLLKTSLVAKPNAGDSKTD
jgi:hypothetical protein